MKVRNRYASVFAVVALLGASSCVICTSCGSVGKESFSRTVELSSPMSAGSSLKVESTNGSITVQGEPTETCFISATITAKAMTKERAQELAEQTEILLEPDNGGLRTVIKEPTKTRQESVNVSFGVRLPQEESVDLETTNGNINATSLHGDVKARTTNGNVVVSAVTAEHLVTQSTNGNIHINQVQAAQVGVETTNGSVDADLVASAAPSPNVRMSTTNGSISVRFPKEISAKVEASTVNGRIECSMALTTYDQKTKTSLAGSIGAGEGNIDLDTTNGSIHIHEPISN
jgi:ribosomal protein S9